MALRRARVGFLVVSVLAVAAIICVWWWPRGLIPPLDGRIPLSGLQAPVEVRFDSVAIPHIRARSTDDAWTAVGYLQARIAWQIELSRAASGRLAELLGEDLVVIDQRPDAGFDVPPSWVNGPPRTCAVVERFAAGVNAAIAADAH
jgi:penicillin amidase